MRYREFDSTGRVITDEQVGGIGRSSGMSASVTMVIGDVGDWTPKEVCGERFWPERNSPLFVTCTLVKGHGGRHTDGLFEEKCCKNFKPYSEPTHMVATCFLPKGHDGFCRSKEGAVDRRCKCQKPWGHDGPCYAGNMEVAVFRRMTPQGKLKMTYPCAAKQPLNLWPLQLEGIVPGGWIEIVAE